MLGADVGLAAFATGHGYGRPGAGPDDISVCTVEGTISLSLTRLQAGTWSTTQNATFNYARQRFGVVLGGIPTDITRCQQSTRR